MKQSKIVPDESLMILKLKTLIKKNIKGFENDLNNKDLNNFSITERELTIILIKHYKLVLALMEKS